MEKEKTALQIALEHIAEIDAKMAQLNDELKNIDNIKPESFVDRDKLAELAKILKDKNDNITFNILSVNCETFLRK